MRDQLGRQFAHPFAIEASLPHEERPAREVESDLCLGLVHGQQKPVACNTALIAQRLAQSGSQSQSAILDRMMLIDVQIAGATQVECEAAMLRDLLQHVIEEPQAGGDRARAVARQIEVDVDVRFLRLAMHLRTPRLPENAPGDGRPGLVHIAVQAYPKTLKPQICREFHIRVAIADHVAARAVDGVGREELLHHADLGLAASTVLALEVRTDADRLELDSLRTE